MSPLVYKVETVSWSCFKESPYAMNPLRLESPQVKENNDGENDMSRANVPLVSIDICSLPQRIVAQAPVRMRLAYPPSLEMVLSQTFRTDSEHG